jgi:short-subunit dehydrogenase
MAVQLKDIDEQVMVITGASSGIGLCTARLAARRGARLVLAARSHNALARLTNEIARNGGRAVYVVADVSKPDDIHKIERTAQDKFGGFDTWVNNAGTSIYGRMMDVPVDDMRRLFETNFWGLVYGSLAAVKHLKRKGGAIINLGSTVSERAVPLQGIYSATKHAIKAFTDALRMELEAEGAPISLSLIKPGPIDTPFTHNAKNYLPTEPRHVPPVYAPETVAEAILRCAETPTRDVFVGGGGKGIATLGYYAPRLTDKLMENVMLPGTKSPHPPRRRERNALDRPSERLAERGGHEGHVAESSLYTEATLHPLVTGAALLGIGWVIASLRGASQARELRQHNW